MPDFNALTLAPLLGPLALFAVFLVARLEPGPRPHRVLRASAIATGLNLALALLSAAAVAVRGPITSPVVGFGEVGLSLRLDALSTPMFCLVAFVGFVIQRYSRHYLQGDGRHGTFVGLLCLTVGAVVMLVLAGNLAQLVLAWVGTSLALHQLLVFYPERRRAQVAARKKFVAARTADTCLVLAALLLVWAFDTSELGRLLARAQQSLESGSVPTSAPPAAVLLAIAALLKSAQFPTHGWLPEVMETPTPVSALLHAGIINAGGFLVLRFADVMLLSTPSLQLLTVFGAFTALFGSVVMLTQSSVKVSLAYSTVAQMGFMLFECGIGAFSLAVVHIVAHSLYKAHAFLTSGSVVEIARGSWVPEQQKACPPVRLALSLIAATAMFSAVGAPFGVFGEWQASSVVLGIIVILGLTHLFAQGMHATSRLHVLLRTTLAAAGVSVAYFVLKQGAGWLFEPVFPAPPQLDGARIATVVVTLAAFAAITALQLLAPAMSASPRWRAAYVHLRNGLYVPALFDRLVGAHRRARMDS
jgi:NAD(P)H-quinone oxidoreductase subunit 5